MRTALKVALAALVVLALLAPTNAGGVTPSYVTHNCTGTKIEPRSIMFACGDGGFYVRHLRWTGWYGKSARARGVYHMNDCDPSCAGGTFHTRRGTLILRYREWCPKIAKHVFRRAVITFDRPWQGEKHESFHLFCPY